MSKVSLVTADELLAMPRGMGKRYELVAGELRIYPAHEWRHGMAVSKIHAKLATFVEQHGLGATFGAETGFRLATDPDTVRAPEIAFIAAQNLPASMPKEAFWPGAPDLTVEVLSPGDRMGEVDEKIEAWLAAGCHAVWVLDPKLKTVTIYRSRTDIEVRTAGETLDGEPLVPGFSCAVDELFG